MANNNFLNEKLFVFLCEMIIKDNELRKGNFITQMNPPIKNFYTKVLGVLEGNVYIPYEGVARSYPIGMFEPIPLTEEWLIRFDFTLVKSPSAYQFDCNKQFEGGVIRGGYSALSGYSYFGFTINGVYVNYKYVHQLQNLYFALTGEELTLK